MMQVTEAATTEPPPAAVVPTAAAESPVAQAEEPKTLSRFKNSFSAVESKPPPVKLPTLVFDKVTSQLTAKTDDDLETTTTFKPAAVTPPAVVHHHRRQADISP